MATKTVRLRAGDEIDGKDFAKYKTVRVIKVGQHREGGEAKPVGTVTLELDDGKKEPPAEPPAAIASKHKRRESSE